MPAIYHPGVVTTVAHHNIGAPHDACNVLHWWSPNTSYTYAELTALQTAFDSNWKTLYNVVGTTGNSYLGAVVTDSGSDTGLQVDNAAFPGYNPSQPSPPLGDNVAVLLSLRSLRRYRGGHGRVYLPGISASVVSGDGRTVQSTPLATLLSHYNSLVAAMAAVPLAGGTGVEPIIWHKHLAVAPNSVEQVQNCIPQPILATQRRRLRKVARHRHVH